MIVGPRPLDGMLLTTPWQGGLSKMSLLQKHATLVQATASPSAAELPQTGQMSTGLQNHPLDTVIP